MLTTQERNRLMIVEFRELMLNEGLFCGLRIWKRRIVRMRVDNAN